MAREVVITDDLDMSAGAQTITFSLRDQFFEIDLAQKNQDRLAKALEPFIAKARPAQPIQAQKTRQAGKRQATTPGYDRSLLREYVAANPKIVKDITGKDTLSRGRPNRKLVDRFLEDLNSGKWSPK